MAEQRDAHGLRNLFRDLVLHREDVVQRAIVGLRPQVIAVCGIDQLRRDANLHAALLHAALEDVCDVELLANIAQVFIAVLEGE